MAIEVNSNDIYSDLVKGISSSDKLRQDFDEAKFRAIYNEEIRKKEAEQTKIQYNAVQEGADFTTNYFRISLKCH